MDANESCTIVGEYCVRVRCAVTNAGSAAGISRVAAELNEDLIIRRMVGRDLTHRFPERHNVPGEVVLRVKDLTSPLAKSFKDVSFELRKGEILGIAGLMGSGRTEHRFSRQPVCLGR